MAFVVKDRVRVSTASTGTGAVTLGAAVQNAAKGYYRTFAAAGVANGDTVPYLIEDGANWEIGIGTYVSSGTQLQRTNVLANSAGTTAPITLSGAAEVGIALIEGMVGLSAAIYRGMAAGKLLTTDAVGAAMEEVPLSISGGNISWDISSGIDFAIPLTASALLTPTGVVVGRRGRIRIVQSGGFTLSVASAIKTQGGFGLIVSPAAGAEDYGFYDCVASNKVLVSLTKDWK